MRLGKLSKTTIGFFPLGGSSSPSTPSAENNFAQNTLSGKGGTLKFALIWPKIAVFSGFFSLAELGGTPPLNGKNPLSSFSKLP